MSGNPPPVYARDYIRSAQIASLGYIAPLLKTVPLAINATGAVLADYIKDSGAAKYFTPEELLAFTTEYRFIGSTSRGKGVAGGDAVAYINDSLHAVVPVIGEYGCYHVGDRFDKAIISHDK